MPRTALLVSPHFPPSTLAGVHRARHLAKHLPAHGWEPIVIRVDERFYSEPSDPALATLVPRSVTQLRASAVPASIARIIGVGDVSLRGFAPLANMISLAVRQHRPRAVLITGAPFYPMLMARRIRDTWGLPVVLDFQDPWVSGEGELRPAWSKGGLAHRAAVALEPMAVRNAAWITSVSETQNAEMARRYGWLDAGKMTAIPIGGDPEDFSAMRAAPPPPTVRLERGAFNLCYVGTFLPRGGAVVTALLHAVALLRRERPRLAARLRLVFVGTSNQPGTEARSTHLVTPFANASGIADILTEHPGRVGYLEALSLLANADGLLLLGSDEPHYTASKIYPALLSGSPFLSLFHALSSSHKILSEAGGGLSFCFDHERMLEALVPMIADGLERLMDAQHTLPPRDPTSYADYTASAVASRFAKIFETVSI